MKRILLIYTKYSSFVKTDFEILSKAARVDKYQFKPKTGFAGFKEIFKQFLFLFYNGWKYDIFYIWFADYHSFLPVLFPRIFRKKSLVVIGGFDAVAIPYLNYGLFCSNKIRQFVGKYSIRNANYVCPVDESLIENTNYYALTDKNGLPVGVKKFVKGIKGEIISIATGYDVNFWQPNPKLIRKKSVLTVGYINDWKRWKLKGCDLIQEIASKMPHLEFHIYGLTDNFMLEVQQNTLPQNLFLHKKINIKELPDIYSQHKIYAQFSLSEGLPNVLCEAILCGCNPVGSNVNGITNIILNKKLVLYHKDLKKATKVIENALKVQNEEFLIQQNYILKMFNIDKRRKAIYELIKKS